MDFKDGMLRESETIDDAPNPIPLLLFKKEKMFSSRPNVFP